MAIEIRQVQNKKERKEFIKFAWQIYRKEPELNKNWVPPVIDDYMKTLDTEKFPLYEHADLAMFTAWKEGVMAGTIAAVENRRHNGFHGDKVGFWGFFECINGVVRVAGKTKIFLQVIVNELPIIYNCLALVSN